MESHGKLAYMWYVKWLQLSKQGQNKIKASYLRKYPKTRMWMILTIFKNCSQTLGPGKLKKVIEKVMEIHGICKAQKSTNAVKAKAFLSP